MKEPTLKEVIFSRRSVRWFDQQPVPQKDIREIVEAGIRAPTASGGEQWYFIAVTDEEKRKIIHEFIRKGQMIYLERMLLNKPSKEEIEDWENFFKEGIYFAPLYIIGLVNYNRRTLTDEYFWYEWQWGLQSVTLALGNMMLTAWSKGYGVVWIAVPQLLEEEFKQALSLPENMSYGGMLAIGKPAKMPGLSKRRPLDESFSLL
jgi:nitroreductase